MVRMDLGAVRVPGTALADGRAGFGIGDEDLAALG
jgi:hypothetical protein